jgi:hypothetical protein
MGVGSQVDIPPGVVPPFEVYVNGVLQEPGADYEQVGPTLLFTRPLAREGKLGTMRWLSMLLGVAGTYRKNDQVDFVYTRDGRRLVAHGAPRMDEA